VKFYLSVMRNNKVSVLLLICWVICFSKHAFAAIEPVSVTINAVAGLQFDLVRFQVKPGAEVRLTFVNNDDMSHNLVFTRPGAREEIVAAALNLGEQGPKMNFIPDSPKVLWAVPVLSPEETKVITFKAPSEPGVYPYVCTYPGHGFVMYGAMYVTNEAMPPIQNDLNIAASRRKDGNPEVTEKSGNAHSGHAAEALHPYKLDPPYLYPMPALRPSLCICHRRYRIAGMREAVVCAMPGRAGSWTILPSGRGIKMRMPRFWEIFFIEIKPTFQSG
jgi:plastocyanin